MKIICKDCKNKCCAGPIYNKITEEENVEFGKGIKKINIDGIPLIRVNKFIWKCKWFKDKKCTNYKNRPDICKLFFCKRHKKSIEKWITPTGIYGLGFKTLGRPKKSKTKGD